MSRDATFNQLQLPVLIAEILTLAGETRDTEAKAVLQELVRYLEGACDQPHVYVRFIGD